MLPLSLPVKVIMKIEKRGVGMIRFRSWANQIVETYTIKGWVMDSELEKAEQTAKENPHGNESDQ